MDEISTMVKIVSVIGGGAIALISALISIAKYRDQNSAHQLEQSTKDLDAKKQMLASYRDIVGEDVTTKLAREMDFSHAYGVRFSDTVIQRILSTDNPNPLLDDIKKAKNELKEYELGKIKCLSSKTWKRIDKWLFRMMMLLTVVLIMLIALLVLLKADSKEFYSSVVWLLMYVVFTFLMAKSVGIDRAADRVIKAHNAIVEAENASTEPDTTNTDKT